MKDLEFVPHSFRSPFCGAAFIPPVEILNFHIGKSALIHLTIQQRKRFLKNSFLNWSSLLQATFGENTICINPVPSCCPFGPGVI